MCIRIEIALLLILSRQDVRDFLRLVRSTVDRLEAEANPQRANESGRSVDVTTLRRTTPSKAAQVVPLPIGQNSATQLSGLGKVYNYTRACLP